MKRMLILCSAFCFLFLSEGAMAQCSKESTSATCINENGNYSPQGQWIIESGIPVTIDLDFKVYEEGGWVGAEADIGSYNMFYYNYNSVGEYLDTKVYPASDNDDGNLYLAIGTSSNAWGEIKASW